MTTTAEPALVLMMERDEDHQGSECQEDDVFISKEEEGGRHEEPPLERLDSSSSSSCGSASDNEDEEEEVNIDAPSPPNQQLKAGGRVSFFRAFFQTDNDEQGAAPPPTTEKVEDEIDPATRKLNEAFLSLEAMRKAHLEFSYGDGVIPGFVGRDVTEYCTACLEEAKDYYCCQRQQKKQHQQQKRSSDSDQEEQSNSNSWSTNTSTLTSLQTQWKDLRRRYPKKAKHPCLVCASPVCPAHACREFRQQGGIHICQSCSHLFTADFVLQTLASHPHHDGHVRYQLARIMDAYDRAYIMLHYSAQFLDDIATRLEQNTKTSDKMGVGSSSMGIVSGITGVGAVAAQAATAIHLAAAATILTPVGPPLLVASILFGGTAASAALGTEAVSYYSTPNQLANKILALSHLVHSLWAVTNVLQEALQLRLQSSKSNQDIQEIVEKMYCRQSRRILRQQSSSTLPTVVDDATSTTTTTTTTTTASKEEKEVVLVDEATCVASASQQRTATILMNRQSSSNLSVLTETAPPQDDYDYGSNDNDKSGEDMNAADNDEEVKQDETIIGGQEETDGSSTTTLPEEQGASNKEDTGESEETGDENSVKEVSTESEAVIPEKGSTLSAAMPLAPFIDDAFLSVCKIFSAPTSGGGAGVAASRVTTNAMKVAQIATVACGALSAATIVMESNNFNRALKSLKAGSPCEKAQMLRNVKEELKQLPDTKVIAAECELYLQATTMRSSEEENKNKDE